LATTNASFRDDADSVLNTLRPVVDAPPVPIDRRVLRVTLRSIALGIAKSFYVFAPPLSDGSTPSTLDEARATARDCPTLYLLRGHEREWVHPHEDGSRRGTAIDVYLRHYQAGRIGPMVLVFPGVTSTDNRVHGMAVDMRAPNLAPHTPGLGSGKFHSYMMDEVVPAVAALFGTSTDGRQRGLEGFSLGGYMAATLGAGYPHLFATVGAFDGTFLYADTRGQRIRSGDRVFRMSMFDPIFGRPRDLAYGAEHNAANLVLRRPAAMKHILWMLRYGPERSEPMGSNYYRGLYLRDTLEQQGLTLVNESRLSSVIEDGVHNWATADRHLSETLPLHWDALRSPSQS